MAICSLQREAFIPRSTKVKDSGNENVESDLEGCTVCLEQLLPGEQIICLPCIHRFHIGCLTEGLIICGECLYCQEIVHLASAWSCRITWVRASSIVTTSVNRINVTRKKIYFQESSYFWEGQNPTEDWSHGTLKNETLLFMLFIKSVYVRVKFEGMQNFRNSHFCWNTMNTWHTLGFSLVEVNIISVLFQKFHSNRLFWRRM